MTTFNRTIPTITIYHYNIGISQSTVEAIVVNQQGTKVLGSERSWSESWEGKFPGHFAPGNESSRERKG